MKIEKLKLQGVQLSQDGWSFVLIEKVNEIIEALQEREGEGGKKHPDFLGCSDERHKRTDNYSSTSPNYCQLLEESKEKAQKVLEEADAVLFGEKETSKCCYVCRGGLHELKDCPCHQIENKEEEPKEPQWKEELSKWYGCMFEAGDYEALVKFIENLLERNKLVSNIALMRILVERGSKGDMERLIKEYTKKLYKYIETL